MNTNRLDFRPPRRLPTARRVRIAVLALSCLACEEGGGQSDALLDAIDANAVDAIDANAVDAASDAGTSAMACDTDESCVAVEPCLSGACVDEKCQWTRPELELRSAGLIQLGAPATDLALADGRLLVARGKSGLESWHLGGGDEPPVLLYERQLEGDEGPIRSVAIAGGRAFVTEMGPVTRALDLETGAPLGAWRASDEAMSVLPDGDLIVVSTYAKGIAVLENGDWQDPQRVARLSTRGRATAAARAGRRLLVADGLAGLAVVNWGGQRLEPTLAPERIDTAGRVDDVAATGELAVLAEHGAGVGFVTLEPTVERAGSVTLDGATLDVALLTSSIAVAIDGQAVWVIDALDPSAPAVAISLGADGGGLRAAPIRIAADDPLIAVALDDASIQLFELVCEMSSGAEPAAN